MSKPARKTTIVHRVAKESDRPALDVVGTMIEFLTTPDGDEDFCVMRGVIPGGGIVPLHRNHTRELARGTVLSVHRVAIGIARLEAIAPPVGNRAAHMTTVNRQAP